MKIAPWYSKRHGETVYHNNTQCTDGKRILPQYLMRGTGTLVEHRTLCPQCARLMEESQMVEEPQAHE